MLVIISLICAITIVSFSFYVFVLRNEIDANNVHIDLLRKEIDASDALIDVRDSTIKQLLEHKAKAAAELKVVMRVKRRGKQLRWFRMEACERAVIAHIGRLDVWRSKDGDFVWAFFDTVRKEPVYLGYAPTEADARNSAEAYANAIAYDVDESFCHENKA